MDSNTLYTNLENQSERPPKVYAAPSIRRLPSYLQVIQDIRQEEDEFISATVIARELQLEPIQVRKDLSITGVSGLPKKGYPLDALVSAIERFLGWDSTSSAVLVGAGNLGAALLGYQGFLFHGLHIMAAFDIDRRKIGATIHETAILNAETMAIQIPAFGVKIAILTVPSGSAQASADILVRAGIEGIWNFTGVKLRVPANVAVQQEDLSAGYALLRVRMKNLAPS